MNDPRPPRIGRGAWALGLSLLLVACASGQGSRGLAGTGAEGLTASTSRFGQTRIEGPSEARNHYAPVIAMLTPGYTFRYSARDEASSNGDDGGEGEHGAVWSVPVWFREPDWRHGAAFSIAQFPTTGRRSTRAVYRLRAWSAPADTPILHLLLGGGGFWDLDDGLGPRAELGWLLGRFGRGGALLTLGWEYVVTDRLHAGDLALTFFVPYVVR